MAQSITGMWTFTLNCTKDKIMNWIDFVITIDLKSLCYFITYVKLKSKKKLYSYISDH